MMNNAQSRCYRIFYDFCFRIIDSRIRSQIPDVNDSDTRMNFT